MSILIPDDDDNHLLHEILRGFDHEEHQKHYTFVLAGLTEDEVRMIKETIGDYDTGDCDALGSLIGHLTSSYDDALTLLKAHCVMAWFKKKNPKAWEEFQGFPSNSYRHVKSG